MTTHPHQMTHRDQLAEAGFSSDLVEDSCIGCDAPSADGVHWHTATGIEWLTTRGRPYRPDAPARIDFARTENCIRKSQHDPCKNCYAEALMWFDKDGYHHRDGDKPALVEFWAPDTLKSREWFEHGTRHREAGPAREVFAYPNEGTPHAEQEDPPVPERTRRRTIAEWRLNGKPVDKSRVRAHVNGLITLANQDAWDMLAETVDDIDAAVARGLADPHVQLALATFRNP